MDPVYDHRVMVPPEAIDANGHVNHVEYVRWMGDAARAHAMACGGAEMAKRLGVAWFVRRHTIEYLRELRVHESVLVRTWVEDFQRVVSLRCYRFLRNDTVMARGETKWVLVDVVTGRPRAIPKELSGCFGVFSDRCPQD